MSNRRYIIDANVLIVAARDYFAIDIFQKLWSSLKDAIVSGRIILIDKVRDEIMCGSDASAEAKIPNVAQHFGIPVCSLVDVLRDLNIRED